MTDHLDLEAIKEFVARHGFVASYADSVALISEVERLQADVERKDEMISRAMRLCEQERALMTLNVLRKALSESPTETKGENG